VNAFAAIVRRDLRLVLRQGADGMLVVAFFVLAAAMFPFAIGPEAAALRPIAGGVLWVCALFAAMLSLERMFQPDFDDGTLELLVLAPQPLELLVLGKAAAHWISTGLPLIVIAPVMGILLDLPTQAHLPLFIAMLLGTPTLSLIGVVGAALTLGARRGGMLLVLLLLPLALPVLIFGAGAVASAEAGLPWRTEIMALGGFLLAAIPLAPWAAAAALRQAVE
jgi:heme exporter protein B